MDTNIWLDVSQVHKFLESITPPNLPILVVDDEPLIGNLIKSYLDHESFENVTLVETGEDAIQKIKEQEFSVIFLDLSLKTMSGIDVLKEIKENDKSMSKNARVIILTGLPSLDTAIEAMQLGAYNYLTKPISMEDFFDAFEKALANFYDHQRKTLIDRYSKKSLTHEIVELKRLLEEKDEEIIKLQNQIDELMNSSE